MKFDQHPRPFPKCLNTPRKHSIRFGHSVLLLVFLLSSPISHASDSLRVIDPIGKMARLFNRQLVTIEDRVEWMEKRLSSIAQHREHAMKVSLGVRCGRLSDTGPDPSVTIDLGAIHSLDSLFLVPTQREFLEDTGLFPRRFTIELASQQDFGQRTVLFASDAFAFPAPQGKPVRFVADGREARYIRITVHQGHHKGTRDVFGLSELVAVSKGDPVSFGAEVSTVGALSVAGIWHPEALTDGHTPLGTWQSNTVGSSRGDCVTSGSASETVSWTLDLNQPTPVDRIVLFPYQLTELVESSVLPESFTLHATTADGETEALAYRWETPLSGANRLTPLIIPMKGLPVKRLRFTGNLPWQMGDLRVHAIAELEVWSGGLNVARGLKVTRHPSSGQVASVSTLTDGFANGREIIAVVAWLNQLHERWRLEQELEVLRPLSHRMASASEFNATWGSAAMLGLSFLIPVFFVERRRIQSRNQLDQLRRRIASDLHDDIGSNLGSISLIARTARKDLVRLNGPVEVADDLGEVESIARESSLAMRDIVWLLERREDSIGDLVKRMRETAGRLLREIDYTIECESTKLAAKLSLDAKRHLFLFYKEAIHNILKHSRSSRVSIRLWDEQDRLALEISDNGIGLPNDPHQRPASVQKLTDRARVLEGVLNVRSAKGEGTQIRLTIKRSLLIAHPSLP